MCFSPLISQDKRIVRRLFERGGAVLQVFERLLEWLEERSFSDERPCLQASFSSSTRVSMTLSNNDRIVINILMITGSLATRRFRSMMLNGSGGIVCGCDKQKITDRQDVAFERKRKKGGTCGSVSKSTN